MTPIIILDHEILCCEFFFMNLKTRILWQYSNAAALYYIREGGNRQSPRILICKFKFLKSFVDLVLKSTLRALSSGDWTPKSCPSTFISRNSFLPPSFQTIAETK